MLQKSISFLVIFSVGFYMGHNTKDYTLLMYMVAFDLTVVGLIAVGKYIYSGII